MLICSFQFADCECAATSSQHAGTPARRARAARAHEPALEDPCYLSPAAGLYIY